MDTTIQIIAIVTQSLMVIVAVILAHWLSRKASIYDLKRETMLRVHESFILYTNEEENADLQLHQSVQLAMIVFGKNKKIVSVAYKFVSQPDISKNIDLVRYCINLMLKDIGIGMNYHMLADPWQLR
ncbi:MAG: hypothetical protein OXE59_04490 [Bacteroidetes bacterium]|nr:hypothetical protein [Bacteroidota bacterium]